MSWLISYKIPLAILRGIHRGSHVVNVFLIQITEYLEQRFYKELRNEHLGSVKVVLHIHKKLLSTCKEQM